MIRHPRRWTQILALWIVAAIVGMVAPTSRLRAEGATKAVLDSTSAPAMQSLRFATALASLHEDSRAITEYIHCLWLADWDSSEVNGTAATGLAASFLALEDYPGLLRWGREPRMRGLGGCRRASFDLMCARAALKLRLPAEAESTLTRIPERCTIDPELPASRSVLLGITCLQQRRWTDASRHFASLASTSKLYEPAQSYSLLALHGPAVPTKSPLAAGLIGILPGAGYAYCGYKQSALSAFVVNLLFASAARQAFRSDQRVLGWFLTGVSLSWYAGSTYGAVATAHRVNDHNMDAFLNEFPY